MEKAQHGYELNAELERREVRDWAGVSRPQVYYSLRKLREQGLIQPIINVSANLGPERQVYEITEQGRQVFTKALARDAWATQRVPPPFLTWLALSPHASRETIEQILSQREAFLLEKLAAENQHLPIVQAEAAPLGPIAELMVAYALRECESELQFLTQVRRTLLGE